MKRLTMMRGLAMVLVVLAGSCNGGIGSNGGGGDAGGPPAPPCTSGTDKDGDQYGPGCAAGPDCDDNDPNIHPGAKEICDSKDNNCNGKVDESETTSCSVCDPNCDSFGAGKPFPTDPSADPNVKEANGVKLDPNGDLTLDASVVNFNYLWIANTYDLGGSDVCGHSNLDAGEAARCRGTISKVDTVAMKETARYFTVHCTTGSGDSCADVNGKPIELNHNHTPSRTAVDYNFDVWVANRSLHGGQPSATKIANDPRDCVDRNKNGKIDTSADQDGDGQINVDCDGNGEFDNASTVCTNGKPPEFLGDDDECILFTTNYAESNDLGRSICLDTGKNNVGASNAWVGTYSRPENGRGNNKYYGIDGNTGKIFAEVTLGTPVHHAYGCMADAHHILWSTDIGITGEASNKGSLTYFSTMDPYPVGKLLRGPDVDAYWKDEGGAYHHYGIVINGDQHVWLGGWSSGWVLRYKPDRTSFATLAQGKWSRFDVPHVQGMPYTRGIAADTRGKVWVSINDGGYLFRLDQSLPDGEQNLSTSTNYWKLTANTVIGAGVDFNGNLWGVGHANDYASRIDVDAAGNVTSTLSKDVKLGRNPYTYSDFTGYGLMNFVRPAGRYVYEHSGCNGEKVTWNSVSWKASTSTDTAVILRVRTGDSETTWGSWSQEFTASPALFGPTSSTPVQPNPARYLQVEFTLKTSNKDSAPVLQEYGLGFSCGGPVQ